MPYYPTRKLTIFALDPSVKDGRRILRTQIEIPNEFLQSGPRGYRAHVIDFDSTNDVLYRPAPIPEGMNRGAGPPQDPYRKASDKKLLDDPGFHGFMTYGIVMQTLARFEYALGRRVSWSFGGHQIQIAPHAFADANAFYAAREQGLFFGYFPTFDGKGRVFSCLSHEVVAHETTHALLDGLRERYSTDSPSPQQAGFHEGFADIVALLSILSAPEVVGKVIDQGTPQNATGKIARQQLTAESLRAGALLGLAAEMGAALSGIHGQALRRSVELKPSRTYLTSSECDEPHNCGEVLVAAVMNAYLKVWAKRLTAIGDRDELDRERVVEEGAEIAERLLTVCIRAIDYCPPTDLQFRDFASAILTADWELNPLDAKYGIRASLLGSFRAYGIEPSSTRKDGQEGAWGAPAARPRLCYDRTHFESMKVELDELFRFIWENRVPFKLNPQAFTRVLSVRPCVRTGRDGFMLRETVAEYHQQLKLFARELAAQGIRKPPAMPDSTEVTLYGGSALIFDEYGRVKYNIGNSIMDKKNPRTQERQSQRLAYLWDHGCFAPGASKLRSFAAMHRRRTTDWLHALRTAKGEED
jgi:hypothetical protein